MSKKIYTTEAQLKKLITEKLGIAKKVVEISNEIEKYVYTFLDSDSTTEDINIYDDLKLSLKKLFYATIEEFYSDYEKDKTVYKNGYSYNDKTIYFTFIIINNILNMGDNVENTIQHEVEHYWQCKQKGCSLSSPHYQEITSLINSNNYYISVIAKLLYYSKKFEIDAQINGAYNQIKNINYINDVDSLFDNTELGMVNNILLNLKNTVQSSDYSNSNVVYALNFININEKLRSRKNKPFNQKRLINIVNKTIDYVYRKIAKMLALHIEDKKNKNMKILKSNFENGKITKTETFL
jgi:hypothetical protein